MSNPSYLLVSPIRPEPHSILALSCKGRAEVILLICTDSSSIQQNLRLTGDGAAVSVSSNSIRNGGEQHWRRQKGVMASNMDATVVGN